MLENLKEKLENLFISKKEEEVIVFDDSIAQQIDWKPLRKGGSSFRTHAVKAIGYNRLEVVATLHTKLLCGFFALIGVGMMGYYLYATFIERKFEVEDGLWGLLLIGVGFFITGSILLVKAQNKKVFDKQAAYFWVGNKGPRETYNFKSDKRFVELSQIYALQIIKERVQTDKHRYYSYELNLVLKDLQRVNVMDHGKLTKLREDAETIARFLNVPVWDAVRS